MAKVNGTVEPFDIMAVDPSTLPPRTRNGGPGVAWEPRTELLAQVAQALAANGGISAKTNYGTIKEARKAFANVKRYADYYAASLTPRQTIRVVYVDESLQPPARVGTNYDAPTGARIRWNFELGKPKNMTKASV